MKPASIDHVFTTFAKANPEPKTELDAPNPYCLLVAIVLSAQATDVGVNKATKALFQKVKTPAQMVQLGEGGLKDHIKTIGLYRSKARHLIETCRLLLERHGGEVPAERAAFSVGARRGATRRPDRPAGALRSRPSGRASRSPRPARPASSTSSKRPSPASSRPPWPSGIPRCPPSPRRVFWP